MEEKSADTLKKICFDYITRPCSSKKDDIDNIYYALKKHFVLLHCYWSFGQPDKEKYDPYYRHLNFNLPAFGICRCTWNMY